MLMLGAYVFIVGLLLLRGPSPVEAVMVSTLGLLIMALAPIGGNRKKS